MKIQLVEMNVTVTANTCERILSICEQYQCHPGRYIEALVDYDQRLSPQERLAVEFDLMMMDAADDDSD
jgi:hypothetical protein